VILYNVVDNKKQFDSDNRSAKSQLKRIISFTAIVVKKFSTYCIETYTQTYVAVHKQ